MLLTREYKPGWRLVSVGVLAGILQNVSLSKTFLLLTSESNSRKPSPDVGPGVVSQKGGERPPGFQMTFLYTPIFPKIEQGEKRCPENLY